MNKKQMIVVSGIVIYSVIYLIASPIVEKEVVMYHRQWQSLPAVLRFKAQSLRNMRFLFLPMLVIAGFLIYWLRDRINKIEIESEEDKKQRIKKLLLRESVILIVSLLVSGFCISLAIVCCDTPTPSRTVFVIYYLAVILSFNYFIYLFIRFILWIIKYSKEKRAV